MSRSRSFALLIASIAAAGSSALLINCSPAEEEILPSNEDAIVGVNNELGLGVTYDEATGKVAATLAQPLAADDKLVIGVRRGVITHESQRELDCSKLAPAATAAGRGVAGKTVYDGPSVSKELVDLIQLYNDERWYGGNSTPEMQAELAKGVDPIVEACVMHGDQVKAKVQTNLAYAWDRGKDLKAGIGGVGAQALQPQAGAGQLQEGRAYNTIDYANFCVQELGEIPFFKKRGNGKYDTFDCRDFVGEDGEPLPGVEGALVPLSVDDEPRDSCDPGESTVRTYDCVDKCDRGMWLTASNFTGLGRKAACQPGVTVTTGKNEQGSHWVLLCRKVEKTSNNVSMLKTKRFNDIAIIGTNPKTGKTCFFQNKEDVGNDGGRVTHPGDVARSGAIWPSTPSSYCTGNCHAADPFVHSPWIDEAKRGNGTPIVPKMGVHPDFPISNMELPYKVVNAQAQGFSIAPQMIGEEVAACATCHRVAGKAFGEFAQWSVGEGNAYYSKITDTYKTFEKTHWMPPRLDGLTAENFGETRWQKAVDHIAKCAENANAAGCQFAPVPTR